MKILNLKKLDHYDNETVYVFTRAEATRLVMELVNQLGDPTLTKLSQGSSTYIIHNETISPIAKFLFLVEDDKK